MSKNVYCNVNMTAFDIIALSCGQQGSGSSSMTMHICSPHYLSQNFCQYIKSQSCCNSDLSPFNFFLYPQLKWALTGHHYADFQGHSDGCDKTALQHIMKCLPELLSRPPETLEVVYWCTKKLFQRISLTQECKYTVLIFIPSVLKPLDIGCTSLKYFTYTSSNIYRLTQDLQLKINVTNINVLTKTTFQCISQLSQ
jgi:hypothetical protein